MIKQNQNFFHKENQYINNRLSYDQDIADNFVMEKKDQNDLDIDDFLNTDPDDMDYDDAIKRDKRTLLEFLYEKIRTEQIILNTFFYKENLKPLFIKIMLFVLEIDLYFFINGLFYNEDYVNTIFELEKDTFSKAAWRFIDNLFYAFIVGVIINI